MDIAAPTVFVEARTGLVQAQAFLGELVAAIAPADPEIRPRLDEAIERGDLAMAPLAVLGAEGVGKSTLVDALIGDDIVPREEQEPATVAPVLLRWGPSSAPAYSVVREEVGEPEPCDAVDEFERLLLQRHNPGNVEGVRAGHVELAHPLLAQGLLLLDMPGLEGVSPAVRERAEKTVAGLRRAVLVVKDREYGPASRVLERWGASLDIEAVVSNWSLDFWQGPDLEEKVGQQRQIMAGKLGEHLAIDPERVFVLHLPSIADARIRPGAPVAAPEHAAETERLRRWVREVAAGPAARQRVVGWAAALAAVHRRLARRLEDRRAVLGVAPAQLEDQQADELIRACTEAVVARFRRELEHEPIATTIEEGRTRVAVIFGSAREEVLAAAASAGRRREELGLVDATSDVVASVCDELRRRADAAVSPLGALVEPVLGTVVRAHRHAALVAAGTILDHLPVQAVPLPPLPADLWMAPLVNEPIPPPHPSGPWMSGPELLVDPSAWKSLLTTAIDRRRVIDDEVRRIRSVADRRLSPAGARSELDAAVERIARAHEQQLADHVEEARGRLRGSERASTLRYYDEQARKLERVELQIRLRGGAEGSS